MDAGLQPLISCCLITTIIRLRKKDRGEMEKIEKYSQKNIRIVYNSFCECMCVCLYRLYLHNIECGHINMCVYLGNNLKFAVWHMCH